MPVLLLRKDQFCLLLLAQSLQSAVLSFQLLVLVYEPLVSVPKLSVFLRTDYPLFCQHSLLNYVRFQVTVFAFYHSHQRLHRSESFLGHFLLVSVLLQLSLILYFRHCSLLDQLLPQHLQFLMHVLLPKRLNIPSFFIIVDLLQKLNLFTQNFLLFTQLFYLRYVLLVLLM